jgi:quercetin dioxygenase-like cupin family protein
MNTPFALIGALVLLATVSPLSAQDPVKLSPKMYKVLLENEHVRVLEFHAKPGEKEPMHSHLMAVVYALTGGKARMTTPDGKSEELDNTPGTTLWRDEVTHTFENTGSTAIRALIVEVKGTADQEKSPGKTGSNTGD